MLRAFPAMGRRKMAALLFPFARLSGRHGKERSEQFLEPPLQGEAVPRKRDKWGRTGTPDIPEIIPPFFRGRAFP